MRPRVLPLILLCLALMIPACTDTEKPTQVVSPGDALRDVILLDNENDCPQADSGEETLDEEKDVTTYLTLHDTQNDPLVVSITQPPKHGDAYVSASNKLTYTPYGDYCGLDTLAFKANDGTCDSDEAFMYYTVVCLNDCPNLGTDDLTVDKNSSVNFQFNPSDIEGDVVEIVVTTPPAHGSLQLNTATGAGTYTPTAGYCGPDAFSLSWNDGDCTVGPYPVNITVDCLDGDGDGVPDDADDCDDSDTDDTIVIDGCDSGVANLVGGSPADANGCTLADKIGADVAAASQAAKNHGKFVSAMAKNLNAMVAEGLIDEAQKDSLMHCIGSSSLNKTN